MGLRNAGVAALSLLALSSAGVAQAASAGGPTEGLKLERVAMMMRHGIRPSTKAAATPAGTTAQPWVGWSSPYGELTPRGGEGARLMGVYYRAFLSGRGLLPRDGCAAGGDVIALASSKQRAIKTAELFVEGLQPGCGVKVDRPDSEDNDLIFHPSEGIDGDIALQAALRQKPGLAAEPRLRAAEFAVLQRVLGCDPVTKAGCDIAKKPSHLEAAKNDTPELEGALSVASTGGQTVLLQYLEGKPMSEVGWGRASKADIQAMLRFHTLKFHYELGAPYVAERYAAPVAQKILDALSGDQGPKVTMLVGHDSNIAALRGFLGVEFTAADYPRNDPPPGGAMGFELLKAASGERYVRAFYTAQTMDQLRELQPLTFSNPPSFSYIQIPGCRVAGEPTLCPLETFQKMVGGKLKNLPTR
ncbi:histidine-type phosphatase [uncultured Caulobacter sp.]|uniref:histidine-type phosphatase n=1 Tax=uncultured Caulobacter sp. TaxID=158749 RepID=UPI00261E175D|nr:histidine-type phosphatase [uncultured Caulobacter sp.]